MQTVQVKFGSRTGTHLIRAFQVLFVPFAFVFFGNPRSISFWVFIVLLIGFEFYVSCIVFATLNENGLVYRRWNKSIQVDWESFQTPKQRWAFYILIKLNNKPFWSRYLLLPIWSPSLHEIALSSNAAERLEDLILANESGRTN